MVNGLKNICEGDEKNTHQYIALKKRKPPKLLQQSGGASRSEKRRLHLRTV